MKVDAILRTVLMSVAVNLGVAMVAGSVLAQDVGGDIGGGAGIFKPKNPETKKNTGKAAKPAPKPRCAWAGEVGARAETASVATAASAINVFFMANLSHRARTAGSLSVAAKVPHFA